MVPSLFGSSRRHQENKLVSPGKALCNKRAFKYSFTCMEDFNAMSLAREEVKWAIDLGLEPSSWIFGLEAYLWLLRDMSILPCSSPDKSFRFLGRPAIVDHSVNPWTVKLITEE